MSRKHSKNSTSWCTINIKFNIRRCFSNFKAPPFNLISLVVAADESKALSFLKISANFLSCLTISADVKGNKIIFLPLCSKAYVLVLAWCKATVSYSHGRPNKSEHACIGTTSKSA